MEKFKLLIKKYGIYLLIFIIGFSVRFCALTQKVGFFYDEPFSFSVSTPTNLSPDGKICKKHWTYIDLQKSKYYKSQDIKKSVYSASANIKDIYNDLKKIRNATIDKQHTNLYYSLLRIWDSGLDGMNSRAMILRGCFLNFIFFTLAFFFMFKLLSLIKNDKKFIATGLFFTFTCTGWISTTILVREYELMNAMFIVATYISLLIFNKIKNNENITYKNVCLYALGLALFSLSGYYSVIYELLLFFTLVGFCIHKKRFEHLKKITLVLILAIIIILLIYPNYFNSFFDNEYSKKTSDKLKYLYHFDTSVFSKIQNCISNFYLNLLYYKGILLVLISTWTIILFNKFILKDKYKLTEDGKLEKQDYLTIEILFILSIIWTVCVLLIAPYYEFRFFAASFGIVNMLWILFTYKLKKPIVIAIAAIYLALSVIPIYSKSKNPLIGNIPYLKETTSAIIPAQYDNLPIVFVYNNWSYSAYYMYFRNNKNVIFEDYLPPKNYHLKKYIMITENYHLPKPEPEIHFLNQYYFSKMYIVDRTKNN